MGEVYHKIQIVSCASETLNLLIELVHRIRKILRFYEVGGNTRVLVHFDPPLNTPLVNKNKHRCNGQCHDCIIRILSITLDCFIRVYLDLLQV